MTQSHLSIAHANSSSEHLDAILSRSSKYATPTFIAKAFCLVSYIYITVLSDCKARILICTGMCFYLSLSNEF